MPWKSSTFELSAKSLAAGRPAALATAGQGSWLNGRREERRGREKERGELGISGSSQLSSAGCLSDSVVRDQQKDPKNEKFTNGNL